MTSLIESTYLKFPFSVDSKGPATSSRTNHVREQIEQVLFTDNKERVFRPEFGVGVRKLIFEPNNIALRNTTVRRLSASLAEALFGEVDPKTLEIDIISQDEKLIIQISYVLAAINKKEIHNINLNTEGSS